MVCQWKIAFNFFWLHPWWCAMSHVACFSETVDCAWAKSIICGRILVYGYSIALTVVHFAQLPCDVYKLYRILIVAYHVRISLNYIWRNICIACNKVLDLGHKVTKVHYYLWQSCLLKWTLFSFHNPS